MSYKIVFTKQAKKDYELVKKSTLHKKVKKLLYIIEITPKEKPFEELQGNFKGLISRRINDQHRLVYEIFEETNTIEVRSMWLHYDNTTNSWALQKPPRVAKALSGFKNNVRFNVHIY